MDVKNPFAISQQIKDDLESIRNVVNKLKACRGVSYFEFMAVKKIWILAQLADPCNDFLRYVLDNAEGDINSVLDNIYNALTFGIEGNMEGYDYYSQEAMKHIMELITPDIVENYKKIGNYDLALPSPHNVNSMALMKFVNSYIYMAIDLFDIMDIIPDDFGEVLFFSAFVRSRTSVSKTLPLELIESIAELPLDIIVNYNFLLKNFSLN